MVKQSQICDVFVKMCSCDEDSCCGCFDRSRIVQFIGVLGTIFFISILVAPIIQLERQKKIAYDTGTISPNLLSDGHLRTIDWKSFQAWQGFIIAMLIVMIISNILIIWGSCSSSRAMLIPWLIFQFIFILMLFSTPLFSTYVQIGSKLPWDTNREIMDLTSDAWMWIIGFIPIITGILSLICWIIVRRLYVELGPGGEVEPEIEEGVITTTISHSYGGRQVPQVPRVIEQPEVED